jgi:formamidopyrimidine-DNA glycosylase
MPELPEVETARRYVDSHAVRSRVVRAEVLDPRMLDPGNPTDLNGLLMDRHILGTDRHRKNLFLCFENGALHIHLGMNGSVHFDEDTDSHSAHERLRLHLDRGVLLLDDSRRFGRFGWFPSTAYFVAEKGLGPDALTISRKEFVDRVKIRKGAIKAVLLDQRVLAGLGNLYVDEVLFQGRIGPRTPASSVSSDDLESLWTIVGEVLNASIKSGTDFDRLPSGYLLRQRERDGTCPRCGHQLSTAVVGGRTTIFCQLCQKERITLR